VRHHDGHVRVAFFPFCLGRTTHIMIEHHDFRRPEGRFQQLLDLWVVHRSNFLLVIEIDDFGFLSPQHKTLGI
jgi:hypothetical protein